MRDLGLSYEAAGHGIQSAIRHEMSLSGIPAEGEPGFLQETNYLKHLRVSVDMRAGDARGLAELLISKGVITVEEYAEHMRLAANEELARYEEHMRRTYGLPEAVSYR